MNNHPAIINNILNTHFVNSLFHVNILNYSAGKIVLSLDSRESHLSHNGALGCIMDCAARIAGYESVGDCIVFEYELNTFAHSKADKLIARAQLDEENNQHVTYCCEIFSVENDSRISLSESHGTLVKINL
jgi:hypothetical protein